MDFVHLEKLMKKFLFSVLCPLAMVAFAGPYDVEEFTAQDVGTPDNYIAAEFGGELTTADPTAVADIQEGRLFVRQKFEDPFGEEATTYQLYQGQAGEQFSSLTALSAEGVDYTKLVKAKFYERRGMKPEEDVGKVYFDGKSVFAEGLTTLIAFVDGAPVTLKGDAPAAEPAEADPLATPAADSSVASASSEEDEYCDDTDPDCEEEDENLYSYDVSGNVDETNAEADNYEYSTTDATDAATARFGIGDEVRFWTAVGLSALAATTAVLGVVQHMKSNEAKDAYDEQKSLINKIKDAVSDACSDKGSADCEAAVDWYLKQNSVDLSQGAENEILTLETLENRRDTNKDTMDSYGMARNIWFGVTAASITAAVVLFVW
jgi:hypothetical protein